MLDRWVKANQNLPEPDKSDLLSDTTLINGGKINFKRRQQTPELTQTSYLRLRSIEEAFPTRDYLCSSYTLSPSVENTPNVASYEQITQYDRSFAIQKIFDLHFKKDYKVETLFTACSIMDRYLLAVDWKSYHRNEICRLAVISMLMAAKIE